MTFKQQALAYLQELPDDCTEEDLNRFLAVRRAVKEGEDAIRAGHFVSQEEIDEMLDRWLAE
jgi:predicted transcriptional regulator